MNDTPGFPAIPRRSVPKSTLTDDLIRIVLWPRGKYAFLQGVVEASPPLLAYMSPGFHRRFLAALDLSAVASGRQHAPVVYFARVGRYVKIGTTRNLRSRMGYLYLGLEDVLAVVPGGREVESAYHERFWHCRVDTGGDGRSELFFLDRYMRYFLRQVRASAPANRVARTFRGAS